MPVAHRTSSSAVTSLSGITFASLTSSRTAFCSLCTAFRHTAADLFLYKCIPLPASRTLTEPFCLFMPAILTEKHTFLSFCHILLHKKELNAVFIHSPSSLLLLIIKCLLLLQSAFFYFDVHSFPFADLNTDTQLPLRFVVIFPAETPSRSTSYSLSGSSSSVNCTSSGAEI